jgi:predicted dehydrogenase
MISMSAGAQPTPLRVAVIGCGAISKEHLTAIGRRTDVQLVGVCDRSTATARWTAERHETAWFTDADELLRTTRPAVVHVLTPPASHRSLAEAAIAAGAHVLVEKPIAATTAEYDEMAAAASAAGVVLLENHNYLCNDNVVRLLDSIASGSLGEVHDVEVLLCVDIQDGRFADPLLASPVAHLAGGAIRDFLTHVSYLSLAMLPELAWSDVRCRWRNLGGNPLLGFDDLSADYVLGDALATIRFSSHLRPECFRITVRGTLGTAETELFQPFFRLEVQRGPKVLSPLLNHARNGGALAGAAATGFRNKILQHSPYHGLHRFVDRFYDAVLGLGPLPTSVEAVRRTSLLVDAMTTTIPGVDGP